MRFTVPQWNGIAGMVAIPVYGWFMIMVFPQESEPSRLERAQIHRLQVFVVSSYFAIKPTRWCPSSLAKLVNISAISLGLMNGGYIYIVIGIINQRSHHWGGTTLQLYNFQNSMLQKSVMKFLRCRDAVDPSSSLGVCVCVHTQIGSKLVSMWEHICFEHVSNPFFKKWSYQKNSIYIKLSAMPSFIILHQISIMLFNRTSLNKSWKYMDMKEYSWLEFDSYEMW